jgi:hypothetical protein
LHAVRAAAQVATNLAPMVRENPELRASAAQLLVAHFNGRGLSTPRAKIPPIAEMPTAPATPVAASPVPARVLIPRPVAVPLVKYPREPRRPLQLHGGRALPILRPLGGAGITKPRSPGPPAWLSPRPSLGAHGFAKGNAPAPAQLGQWLTRALAPENKMASEKGPEERKETDQPLAGPSRMPGGFPT